MDVRARIYSYYPSLTKSEQKVADAVLERNVDLIYHSVTELSEFAEVGETTIMRFCRKIGFKGYQDFKLALAQDKAYQNPDQPDSGNGEEETARGVYRHAVQALDTCLSLLDKVRLQKAVDLIDAAGHVQFFGVGASGITALDAKNRFMRIGRRAEAVADSHMQMMAAMSMRPGDVAVGFSVSGSTLDTNDMLAKAKQSGASVIAITNFAKSPITGVADVVLLTAGKESPLEGGSMAAKIAQLFVLDLLCQGLAEKRPEWTKEMKERTAKAVIERIY